MSTDPNAAEKLHLHLLAGKSKIAGVKINRLLDSETCELDDSQLIKLLTVRGHELLALMMVADLVRERQVGNDVSYVLNHNINFTNVCVGNCKFCSFSVRPNAKHGKIVLSETEITEKVQFALGVGATEICMQGGLSPDASLETYVALLDLVKSVAPSIHIHAFSPEEIKHASVQSSEKVEDVLNELKRHGLGSMPGTAAEILDDEIRHKIAPRKMSTAEWVDTIASAHQVGIPTSSTMMYGHIEGPHHVAKHLRILLELQKETNGITEFVPLPFIHANTSLYKDHGSRPGSTGMEDAALYATARLFLGKAIPNIQASWVKTGTKFAQLVLNAGVNDLGGTLLEENITKSAGGMFGTSLQEQEFIRIISDASRVPVQRDTVYNVLRRPTE